MSDKPASPFAGLDKALLRSTREQPSRTEEPPEQQLPATESERQAAPDDTTGREPVREVPSQRSDKHGGGSGRRQRGQAESTPTIQATSKQKSNQASLHASKLADEDVLPSRVELIESIRKAVKVPGKEVSFIRLTAAEKSQLADVVYTYKRQGKKTSENEINRIAINFLLADYREHGEQSILAGVIDSLLA